MNLFLVWQDRALSVYILRTLFAAYLEDYGCIAGLL